MAGSLVALVGGVRAYIAITKAGTAANMIFTGGMKLLKLAFLDSPWGWVVLGITAVVAAVIYCWNHFKGFRDFIIGAFNGIKNAAASVGRWFAGPFAGFFVGAFNRVRAGATWLWNGIKTVGNGIVNVFRFVITLLATILVTPWVLAWHQMAGPVSWLWHSVIEPAWNGIKTAFSAAWNWIKNTVINAWNREIHGLGIVFGWLYNTIIKPVWDGIRDAFNSGWGFIRDHVVNPFKSGIHSIGEAFSRTGDWIRTSWDKVKDAAASPVRWVVNTVYTNGIEKVWNSVAHAVGLNLNLPDAPKFANGGINAGYAPGHDTVLAMTSPGEAWMVPEWTRAVGADNIYRWNRIARQGGPEAVRRDMMGYATGGVVPHFGIGGFLSGVGNWFKGVGGKAKNMASHAWSATKNVASNAWNTTKDVVSDVAGAVVDFAKDPGAYIRSKIVEPVKSMLSGIGAGNWGTMIARFPMMIANGLVDKAKSLWDSVSGAGSFKAGAGVAQWTPQVLQALKMLGQPASMLNTVLRRMNQESGGNPNAINNWDSNAKAGMPSQGLMQTIPGTFHAYAGPFSGKPITDPLANIYAGLNYAIHRYGSLDALNRPGGYATGGIVPRRLYDTGGVLDRGMTLVENRSGSPELVLNRSQQELLFSKRSGDHDKPVNVEPKQVVQNFDVRNYGMNDPYSHGTIFARTVASQARVSLSGRS